MGRGATKAHKTMVPPLVAVSSKKDANPDQGAAGISPALRAEKTIRPPQGNVNLSFLFTISAFQQSKPLQTVSHTHRPFYTNINSFTYTFL